MLNRIELYKEPYEFSKTIGDEWRYSELSENQCAFLCGLIKMKKPKKILEVGTSGGGTTSIILSALKLLDIEGEVHTVDLCKNYYKDKTKPTGYFAKEVAKRIKGKTKLKIYRGNIVGAFLEEIGNDIDLCFLDAAHTTPGEILDFISVFPYLKSDAIVVIHDISLMHKIRSEQFATANCILFASVVGEKYINKDNKGYTGCYPNIGAFQITPDTKKYISNVFLSLIVKWSYYPSEEQLNIIRKIVERNYDEELLKIYDESILLNIHSKASKDIKYYLKRVRNFIKG